MQIPSSSTICCTVRFALYMALVSSFSDEMPLANRNARCHLGLPVIITNHGVYIVNSNPYEARIRNTARKQASNNQKFGFRGNGSSLAVSCLLASVPAGYTAASCSPFSRLVSIGCAQGCGWASLARRSQPEDAPCRSRRPARRRHSKASTSLCVHPQV